MENLRQYSNATQINEILGKSLTITDAEINSASQLIDDYTALFLPTSLLGKAVAVSKTFATGATFADGSVTLPSGSWSKNHFKFQVIEILEDGEHYGKRFPILSSDGDTLTIKSGLGITGELACRTYQLGKYPMRRDLDRGFKTIPMEIAQAVAYQVEFDKANLKKRGKTTKKSESIGTSYSYTNADGSDDTIENRIAPKARDIIDALGFNIQTIS